MTLTRKTAIILAVVFLIGIGLGAWGVYAWQVNKLQAQISDLEASLAIEKDKSPQVQEAVHTEAQTEVQYVPKENTVYSDANSQQIIQQKELTDVQADIDKPKVSVMVNNKPYQFDLLQGETQKFQDGKVLLNQSSQVSLNIKTEPVYFHASIGAWITKQGPAVSIGVNKKNLEAKVIATVPDAGKFYGAGVEYHF